MQSTQDNYKVQAINITNRQQDKSKTDRQYKILTKVFNKRWVKETPS